VLNVLLGLFTRAFSEFERHHTKSGLESSVSIKLFLALVVNSALIPVLVFANISKFDFLPYLFQGPYTDFEVDWYQTVSATLSFTLVVNAAVFPLTALWKAGFKSFSRFAFGGGALTQRQLNKMYEGDQFDLSERYAQMLSMVFVSLCFQAAMPLLVPVTALFCYAVYHEAKVHSVTALEETAGVRRDDGSFFLGLRAERGVFQALLHAVDGELRHGSQPGREHRPGARGARNHQRGRRGRPV
jgi:hypothetical protein